MAFRIRFATRGRDQLQSLRKRDQQIIVQNVAVKLAHRPDQPTRQIKKLVDNEIAPWEPRVGDYRVFYDIDRDAELVTIMAVGQKTHDILRIGGKEIDL
jgi:mRNA-degrading endonuclease RelE of RelBE toxin-antitoxin system